MEGKEVMFPLSKDLGVACNSKKLVAFVSLMGLMIVRAQQFAILTIIDDLIRARFAVTSVICHTHKLLCRGVTIDTCDAGISGFSPRAQHVLRSRNEKAEGQKP